jgi:hypothetical protein
VVSARYILAFVQSWLPKLVTTLGVVCAIVGVSWDFVGVGTLAGQETGPITGPPPQYEPAQPENPSPLKSPMVKPSEDASPPPKSPAADRQSSGITKDPPSIPVDQIIQQFAAREVEFKNERENFTYVQSFVVQTIGPDDEPDGEYRMTSDITFTPAGKRYEVVTKAPPPTLQRVSLSEQDMNDLRNVQPFVLTTDELPKYDVTYVGREQIDEISAYVFDVAPKKIEKNQRYFQGRIWVDDKDLEIVKTYGKAVPDIRKGGTENVFPRFETYRENIEGHFWFPTYTRADDVLHFRSETVRIHMVVRYSNYRRFRVSMRLVPTPQNPPPNTQPPPQNP